MSEFNFEQIFVSNNGLILKRTECPNNKMSPCKICFFNKCKDCIEARRQLFKGREYPKCRTWYTFIQIGGI